MPLDAKEVRRRRSSSLVYTEPPESLEQLSDQSALPNLNAEWVNAKGECILGVHYMSGALKPTTPTRSYIPLERPTLADDICI